MFKRHAVVVEKSCDSDWRRRQQAKPACSFFSDDAAQTEIDTGRQTDSQHRTNKLPRRQTEKDGFPVRTDFFWNFDFYKNRLRFVENLTEFLGYEIIFIEIGNDENHVHFLVQSVPIISVTKVVTTIKSITAREIFKEFPKLRKDMWGSNLWTSGYYVNTVGLYASKDTIKNYIKNQGSEEQNYKKIYEGQLKFDL